MTLRIAANFIKRPSADCFMFFSFTLFSWQPWLPDFAFSIESDWHQQIHAVTKEEMQMIGMGANKLDQYIQKDCFRDAAFKLSKKCLIELQYNEKISFAIELTLCELKTASLDPPLECLQHDNQEKCVNALSRIPQWWTSFSGYVKETVLMCYSVRHNIEKQELSDVYRNVTYLQLFNYNVLQKHTKDFENLKTLTDAYTVNVKSIFDDFRQQAQELQPLFGNTKSILTLIETVMVSLSKQVILTKQGLLDLNAITKESLSNSKAMVEQINDVQSTQLIVHKTTIDNSYRVLSTLKESQLQIDNHLSAFSTIYTKTKDLLLALEVLPLVNQELDHSLVQSSTLSGAFHKLNSDIKTLQTSFKDIFASNLLELTQQHSINLSHANELNDHLSGLTLFVQNIVHLTDDITDKYKDFSSAYDSYTKYTSAHWQYLSAISNMMGLYNVLILGVVLFIASPKWFLFLVVAGYLFIVLLEYVNTVLVLVCIPLLAIFIIKNYKLVSKPIAMTMAIRERQKYSRVVSKYRSK